MIIYIHFDSKKHQRQIENCNLWKLSHKRSLNVFKRITETFGLEMQSWSTNIKRISDTKDSSWGLLGRQSEGEVGSDWSLGCRYMWGKQPFLKLRLLNFGRNGPQERLWHFFLKANAVSLWWKEYALSLKWNQSLVAQKVKNLPVMRETQVQSLCQEDFPGRGNDNPLQYSCLKNPMDRGAWWAAHGVTKIRTQLSD